MFLVSSELNLVVYENEKNIPAYPIPFLPLNKIKSNTTWFLFFSLNKSLFHFLGISKFNYKNTKHKISPILSLNFENLFLLFYSQYD